MKRLTLKKLRKGVSIETPHGDGQIVEITKKGIDYTGKMYVCGYFTNGKETVFFRLSETN